MKKIITTGGVLFSLLPITAWCDGAKEFDTFADQPLIEKHFQYYAGIKAGGSLLSNDDSATLTGGGVVDSEDSGMNSFGGFDLGVYTPDGRGRVYYSYEYHNSNTQFNGHNAYDTNVNLHLISADHLFRPGQDIRPFAGLHVGYAFTKTDSNSSDGFKDNGIVFGVQAGLSWQVMTDFGLEMGLRHTVLPSNRRSWQADHRQGGPVTVETQLKGVSSAYVGATYRF
ncbi:hypothetical protein [Photobacterium nomapromontoriensis]|uniref:hypothetical protein n=1 Tax=Photobacterium nomapromontoriensis TaxID=2910237 RepID=UPI003D11E14F